MASNSPGTSQQQSINMRQPGDHSPVTWVTLQSKDSSELWIPVQKDQKPFQCGFCSIMFDVNRKLVSHINKHSFTKPYQCGYCKVSYDNNQELTVHVKMHTMFMIQVASSSVEDHASAGQMDEEASSQCEPVITANKDSNQDTVDSENDSFVVSPHSVTDTDVSSISEVNDGKGIKHEELNGGKFVKLEECWRKSTQSETDQRGKSIEGIEKPFSCDLCSATFKAARYVSDHKRRIHNVYSRQAGHKQDHCQSDENVCDLELEVQTEGCGESFTGLVKSGEIDCSDKSEAETECNTESLVEQVKAVEIVISKPFLCNICGASFKAPRYVRDHKRRIHKMPSPRTTQKQAHSHVVPRTTLGIEQKAENRCSTENIVETEKSDQTDQNSLEVQTDHCVGSMGKKIKPSQGGINACDRLKIGTELSVEKLKESVKYSVTDECDKSVVQNEHKVDILSGQVTLPESEVDQDDIFELQTICKLGSLVERENAAEVNKSNPSESINESVNERAKSVTNQDDNAEGKTESKIESSIEGVRSKENEMDQGFESKVKSKCSVKIMAKQVRSAELGLGSVDRKNRKRSRNKPFPCNICGATFKASRYVRDHKRRIHKIMLRQSAHLQTHSKTNLMAERADPNIEVKTEDGIGILAEISELGRIEIKTEDSIVDLSERMVSAASLDDKKRKIRPFTCNICGATFKAARYVRDHKRKIHKISLRRTYQRVSDSQIDGDGLIKLEECTELKLDSSDRRTAKQPFRCNICGATFKHARYVKDHKRRIHNMYCRHSQYYQGDEKDEMSDLRPFACPQCPWRFKAKFALQSHVARVHENKRPFVCLHCKDCFKTRRDLAIHEHRRHMTKKPHECADCKQTFKVRDDLLQHYCQPKPCPLCNQMLSNHRTYYYHMRHNHRTEPFQCRWCELSGVLTRREIEIHMKSHPNAKPKSFVCEFCGQAFAKLMTLTYHRNGRHLNIKPYKCSICQKSFNSLPNMRNHKRRHSGDRRYTCDRCGKKFYTSGCLLRHSKTHSDHKNYACTECGATYKKHINFAYHLKNSHGV